MNWIKAYFSRMKGGEATPERKPLSKVCWSCLGAFLGILSLSFLDIFMDVSESDRFFLIGSFGASAVLLYGAPQSEFAQPRNLVGGHIISALIGATLYKIFPGDLLLASACAVSLSIAFMHLTVTMHPPGGATALIAVIGSSQIHDMGFGFVFFPIFTGVLIMLLVGLFVNNLSSNQKRHYPRFWY